MIAASACLLGFASNQLAGGIGKFSIFLEDRDTYRNDIPRVPTIVYCQSLCLLKLQIFSYQYASYMVSIIASDFKMIRISFYW